MMQYGGLLGICLYHTSVSKHAGQNKARSRCGIQSTLMSKKRFFCIVNYSIKSKQTLSPLIPVIPMVIVLFLTYK
jgi:hypothetical protein